MKRNTVITCTMTLLAAAIVSSLVPAAAADAAAAQQTTSTDQSAATPPPANNKNPNKKNTAAPQSGSSQPTAQTAKTLQGVVVTPLQDSLRSAQSIKENSAMIVDSVVAEDIGKLPDNSVADALQRITGVQVAQGFQSETTSVVIRGLPNAVTTLNGREIFGSNGREFSFQDLPATAVSGLDVYKSTDASMVTGGIAGTVDIRTFRPLDFDGLKVSATFTDTNSEYGAHTDPNGSFLVSDRWHTDYGDFGALLGGGITTAHYDYNVAYVDSNLTSVLSDGHGNPIRTSNGDLVVGNNQYGANYNIGYRQRPEANYALQWKPNDNTEVYLEGLYTWYHDNYNQPFYFTDPQNVVAPSSVTTNSGACFPVGLTGSPYYGQTICPVTSATYTGNYYAATSTQAHQDWGHNIQNAIGLKWKGDNLHLSTDLTRNASSYYNENFVIDTFLDAFTNPLTTSYSYPQNWGLVGNPQNNPKNYYLNGLYQAWNRDRATQTAWRFDGSYDLGNSFVNSVNFGLRYADTHSQAEGASFDQAPPGGAYLANGQPNPANNVVNLFGADYFCNVPSIASIPGGALSGCYNYLVNNKNALREFYGLAPSQLAAQDGQYFNIGEKTYSLYGELNYGNELFGLPFDGVLGVRLEKIDRNLNAYTYDTASDLYSPIGVNTSQHQALPNATFNLHFTDNLQMRMSAGKTLEYPDFSQLNPSLSLSPPTANTIATGSGGNAYLKPTKSNSYDATLEWYFSDVGSLTGGVFYHDISGYIENYNFEETIGSQTYEISGPQSSGSGHLDGVELAYTQFFNFLPGAWSGLGMQANYTYIQSSLKTPAMDGQGFITAPFQNVSKDNYNIVGMYEKYGWSVRLAYSYRSRYAEFFLANTSVIGNNAQMYDEPASQLDLSIGYDINKYLTVVFNATNLLGNNFRQYAGPGTGMPQDLRYTDRTYGLGVRFKM
jgi:iron complex outermembrane recepter protein